MLTEAQARTAMFMVRAQDTRLRGLAERLKLLDLEVTLGRTPSDSDRTIQSMAELFIKCNLRIGGLLRGFDDEVLSEGRSGTVRTGR